MSIEFVGYSRLDPRGGGLAPPSGYRAGDLLVMAIASDTWWVPWLWPPGVLDPDGREPYEPPAGWTLVRGSASDGDDRFMAIAYKIAEASEPTLFLDVSPAWVWDAVMVAYRDAGIPVGSEILDWDRWYTRWKNGPVWPVEAEYYLGFLPGAGFLQEWPTNPFRPTGPWWPTGATVTIPAPGNGGVIAVCASRMLGRFGLPDGTPPPVSVSGAYTLDLLLTPYDPWWPYFAEWEWQPPFFFFFIHADRTTLNVQLEMPTSYWHWRPGWFFDTRFWAATVLVKPSYSLTALI